MKTLQKILLFSFLAILTVGQAAAWEQSFDNSSSDESLSLFTDSGSVFSVVPAGSYTCLGSDPVVVSQEHNLAGMIYPHGTAVAYTENKGLNINKPYTNYLGFSATTANGYDFSGAGIELQLLDVNNNILFTGCEIQLNGKNENGIWKRIEYIRSGNTINAYLNGVQQSSASYSGSDAAKMRIIFRVIQTGGVAFLIDDISSSSVIISSDNTMINSDSYQYYKVGYPPMGNVYWFTRLYSPSGNTILTYNLTGFGENQISKSVLGESGIYTIRSYQHSNLDGNNYSLGSKTFTYSGMAGGSAGTISINKTSVMPGNTINIYSHINKYAPGYFLYTRIPLSDGTYQDFRTNVTSEDQYTNMKIPSNAAQAGYLFLYLVDPNSNVASFANYNIFTAASAPVISFDKKTYDRNANVRISFKNAFSGSSMIYYIKNGDNTVYTWTFSNIYGSGSLFFNLSQYPAGDGLIAILKDVSGNPVNQTSAIILAGNATLTGRVYDTSSGMAVPGATVTVSGVSTTSDDLGNYQMNAYLGKNSYSVSKTGYNTFSGNINIYDLITQKNLYITPVLSESGYGIYGTVTSFMTGKPIQGASVVVSKDSYSQTAITDSRGFFRVKSDNFNGNCTLSVQKTGYDYMKVLVPVTGFIYRDYKLLAVPGNNENEDAQNGTAANSGATTNTTEDRPGREAARNAMQQFELMIPALIGLVILKVVMELMS